MLLVNYGPDFAYQLISKYDYKMTLGSCYTSSER